MKFKMFFEAQSSIVFKEGDLVYHTGRKQDGIFVRYDDRNTTNNNNGWVYFKEDDEELMVSLDRLEKRKL